MGPEHGAHPDVVRTVDRTPGIADHAGDVELHVRSLGQLEVEVGAIVIPVVREVVIVAHRRNLLHETVLVHEAERHEIADLVGTAGDVHVVLGLEEGLAEHQLMPLGIREHHRVGAGAVGLDSLA